METPALKDDSTAVEEMTQAEPATCPADALTTSRGHSQQCCASPFCSSGVEPLEHGWRRTQRRYCSSRCRMDGYALRRAKALLDRVGTVEFHRLLDEV